MPNDYQILKRFFSQSYPKLVGSVWRRASRAPRRQTGQYPTNRESRWVLPPTHPEYASREECERVAAKLLAHLLEFDEAPEAPVEVRQATDRILGHDPQRGSYRCPISGKKLNFRELVQSTDLQPIHGRSPYPMGHLVPTAKGGRVKSENIVWMHALGNRIQGEDSVDETVAKILRIAEYHRRQKGLSFEEFFNLLGKSYEE